jgi:hypothetical protein
MFHLWQACRLLLTLSLTSSVGIGSASADFLPIDLPDATYTRGTALLPASGGSSVSDGRLTAYFYQAYGWPGLVSFGLGAGPFGDGWGTPPLVESASPQALWVGNFSNPTNPGTLVILFSSPIKTFGFEAKPAIGWDAPLDQWVDVEFEKGGQLVPWLPHGWCEPDYGDNFCAPYSSVGGIGRRVYQDQGALLFAATTSSEYFTRVWVHFRDAGHIARLRYSVGEQPAPTHAQFFARSIGRRVGPPTVFTGQPDQVTMNVGETLAFTYLVEFRNTGEFLDVTDSRNTDYFTDPPMGKRWSTSWEATEETRNKIFPIYARYREPYTGQSITDTIRVYVRP